MTPLEALKKLENYVNYEMGIKTFQQSGWHIEGSDEYAIIEKSLKALEIIKERFVWLENGELYCGRINDIQMPIDEEIEGKEEMELLKEVMLWKKD